MKSYFHLGLLVTAFLPCVILQASELPPSHLRQQAIIGVLVDLHHPVEGWNETAKAGIPTNPCGPLNLKAFEELAAVRWALEIINNKTWPEEFNLDIVVHDTCGVGPVAAVEIDHLLRWANKDPSTPLIGAVVIGSGNNEKIIDEPLQRLNNGNVSAVVTSSRGAELLLSRHPNVFTTSPDLSSVKEAVIALLNQLSSRRIALVSSCPHAISTFQSIAHSHSIKVNHVLLLEKDSTHIASRLLSFLKDKKTKTASSVVFLLESSELERLVYNNDEQITHDLIEELTKEKSYILGSVDVNEHLVKRWSYKYHSNLLIVQPHASAIPDFKEYFVSNIVEALNNQPSEETQQYIQRIHNCKWSTSEKVEGSSSVPSLCKRLTEPDVASAFNPVSDIGYIVNALSAYSAALRIAQLDTCKTGTVCDISKLSAGVIKALQSFNFPVHPALNSNGQGDSTIAANHELEGTRGRINHQGQLVSRKYDIYLSKKDGRIAKIGLFSNKEGLVLDVMLGMPLVEDSTTSYWSDSNGLEPLGKNGLSDDRNQKESFRHSQPYIDDGSVNARRLMSHPEYYISRVWAMVAVAIAITGAFTALYMLVYVLQRICDGTLQGNQTLGIVLLLVLMAMYTSVVLFVLPPSTIFCNLRVFIPSIASSLCFGILLLKEMNLRSYVSLGLGGRIPILNQFITIVCIVGTQIALNLQWYMSSEEDAISMESNEDVASGILLSSKLPKCSLPHANFLYLHGYIGTLICAVFLYGLSVIKIRRNHNEIRWITLASFLSLPIACAWILVVHFGPEHFQEPAACLTFVATATVILFSIFVPKLSTISHQSSLLKRKQMLQQGGPGYTGSISTIFTNISDRGTLQSKMSQHQPTYEHRNKSHMSYEYPSADSHNLHYPPYIPPPPPMPSHGSGKGRSVSYSPRLTTNFFHASSPATSLPRSVSMKTPFYDSTRRLYH